MNAVPLKRTYETTKNREIQVLLSHQEYRNAVIAYKEADSFKKLAEVSICGAMIDINSQCNFGNCLNCIDQLSVNKPDLINEMSWQTLKALIEDIAASGCRFIEPMGGEPMMHSAYDELLKLTTRMNIALKIVSNGSLAHLYIPELKEASMIPGSSIRFSVNGDEKTYGSITRLENHNEIYRQVLQNIELLKKENVQVLISYVVFPENSHTIYSASKKIKESGASRFLLLPGRDWRTKRVLVEKNGLIEDEIQKTRRLEDSSFKVIIPQTFEDGAGIQTKDYKRCACSFLKPVIGVDGKLFPCSYFKQRGNLVLGRLNRKNRFRDIWKSEVRVKRSYAVRPDIECLNLSCTRHYLNCYIDRLDGSQIRQIEKHNSFSSDELFF